MVLRKKDNSYRIAGEEIDKQSTRPGEIRILKPYCSLFESYGPFKGLVKEGKICDITPDNVGALSISERIKGYTERTRIFLPRIFVYGGDCIIHGRDVSCNGSSMAEIPRNIIDDLKTRIENYESSKIKLGKIIKKRVKEKDNYVSFREDVEGVLEFLCSKDTEKVLDELAEKLDVSELWRAHREYEKYERPSIKGLIDSTIKELLSLAIIPRQPGQLVS